jgi:cobalt-zinc-cadmium efflux system outer membrane protein
MTAAILSLSMAWLSSQVSGQDLPPPRPADEPGNADVAPALALSDLIRLSLEQNPALQQAGVAIDAARGRAVQAGLYPNPTVSTIFDELGDRTGPGGVNTLPLVSQEIVTAGKLRLNRAVAGREVDQAFLGLVRQRFVLLTVVRQGYFDVLAAQRRVEVLTELVKLAGQAYETTKTLLKQEQVAKLDLLQFQVELNRFRAELEAARREQTAAWRRLVAAIGVPKLPDSTVSGSLEAVYPEYDFEQARGRLLELHPDIQSARVGVDRAELALKRARVEPIPNITVGAGYVRQNQNRSDDWTISMSVPVPLWNRNQGNIQAAQAEFVRANLEVSRVQNELLERLAGSYGQYAAARERVIRYQAILKDARELFDLANKAYKGGQFEYLRVLQAQRAVQETNLEYLRARLELWRAASDLAGLLLEEDWAPGKPEPDGDQPRKE